MGRKGGKKGEFHPTPGRQPCHTKTFIQESSGKKQGNLNAKTMCKLDHLKNIAAWAATEASIPSLGAFLGQRLAATTEALGLRNDPALFLCERCECILQPGHNCTVRIEKNKSKGKHRCKKSSITTQNNVVYKCHFCLHRNAMRGTPKGYVKEICPPKAKPPPKSSIAQPIVQEHIRLPKVARIAEVSRANTVPLPVAVEQDLEASTPTTPAPETVLSLLESKRRKRNRSSAKKVPEVTSCLTAADERKSVQASSKRRKKSWTSLKEIAESSEHDAAKKLSNLTIPFFI